MVALSIASNGASGGLKDRNERSQAGCPGSDPLDDNQHGTGANAELDSFKFARRFKE